MQSTYTINEFKKKNDFIVLKSFTAGIVLNGSEVKSIKQNKFQFQNAYAHIKNNEIFVTNFNISEYQLHAYNSKYESKRDKKLLIKKSEIKKIQTSLKKSSSTVKVFAVKVVNNLIKLEIVVVINNKNKLLDKRRKIQERNELRKQQWSNDE